jgi:hypothetical protein
LTINAKRNSCVWLYHCEKRALSHGAHAPEFFARKPEASPHIQAVVFRRKVNWDKQW